MQPPYRHGQVRQEQGEYNNGGQHSRATALSNCAVNEQSYNQHNPIEKGPVPVLGPRRPATETDVVSKARSDCFSEAHGAPPSVVSIPDAIRPRAKRNLFRRHSAILTVVYA